MVYFGLRVAILTEHKGIQRKNFYKEAGLSTYGDWAILNKRYLALITINNIKDAVSDGRSPARNANYVPYSVEGGNSVLKTIAEQLAASAGGP
jgi:hypothetical protein